jgi:hypothetical protein
MEKQRNTGRDGGHSNSEQESQTVEERQKKSPVQEP